ncbi:putative protein kinase RLK-Pelle-SD-2b family [Dioscorea sansibarensis]
MPPFSCPLLFLFVLFVSLTVQHCSGGDTISRSQRLKGNQTIVSKEGHFELGFFSPGNSKNFYIGIWYKKVSPQTVIWVANREVPISNASSSELKITENGNLALVDHKKAIAWSSKSVLHQANSTEAVLLDTGNLVLRDSLNSSIIVWQSFDHPTDTWVPGGWLGMNKITGEYQIITSWKNSEDPAPGPFTDTIDPSGQNQFLLMWNGTEVYWNSGVWNGHSFGETYGMNTSPLFVTNFTDDNEKRVCTETVHLEGAYMRNMMDTTGQNRQWLWTTETQAWITVWNQPVAACHVYSVCGTFGICNQSSKTLCSCPPGFKPVSTREWDLNDWNSGCTRKTNLRCSNDNSSVAPEREGFLEMHITTLPSGSQPLTRLTAEECKQACLKSCSCTAYSYDSGCLIWNVDLRNIEQTNEVSVIYIRLAASDLPVTANERKNTVLVIIIGLCSGLGALFGITAVVVRWMFLRRRQHKTEEPIGGTCIRFKYSDLRHMTKNFSNKLGQGGFGSVFKGTLPTLADIAVKQLDSVTRQDKDFQTEVITLGRLQHIYLIRLLGFCCEGTRRLLVYDYMPNGSLDRHLFNKNGIVLDWSTRYQIIVGVAKGLEYLHEKCRDRIIHCDIKPENVLLDSDFCPKLSDFGMAKLIRRDFSRVLTTMRGTIGYLAPEWILGQPITPKADVYSFGMMLFEVVSGRRNTDQPQGTNNKYFPVWAATKLIEGDVLSLLDENLARNANIEELSRACKVACWCIQEYEANRPSMGLVVLMLEGVLEVNLAPVPSLLLQLTEDQGSII